jgi:predicted small lipoprotein YifL
MPIDIPWCAIGQPRLSVHGILAPSTSAASRYFMRKHVLMLIVTLLSGIVSGCGLKGPLYLPEPATPIEPISASTSDDEDDDDDDDEKKKVQSAAPAATSTPSEP